MSGINFFQMNFSSRAKKSASGRTKVCGTIGALIMDDALFLLSKGVSGSKD